MSQDKKAEGDLNVFEPLIRTIVGAIIFLISFFFVFLEVAEKYEEVPEIKSMYIVNVVFLLAITALCGYMYKKGYFTLRKSFVIGLLFVVLWGLTIFYGILVGEILGIASHNVKTFYKNYVLYIFLIIFIPMIVYLILGKIKDKL